MSSPTLEKSRINWPKKHAQAQFEQFDGERRALADTSNASDFDQAVKRLTEKPPEEPRPPKGGKKKPDGEA